MSHLRVCARFRPDDHGEDTSCVRAIDSESFIVKDEKKEEFEFSFDKVFYQGSEQADVYEFIALPIIKGAVNGMTGAIITYGQTGAGKTYSMEGPSISNDDERKKGLLPRVVDGIFEDAEVSHEIANYSVKLSMVEIYMEKLRDLFDLSKDDVKVKESKVTGVFLSGATEICISNSAEALQSLSRGIANKSVGETQMNMFSSRSHCIYMFTIQQELTKDKRTKSGKLFLVDLAGSEKADKTGAEGRVLEEAKAINKSLSALGNVINALTSGSAGKANHIPYRDSKLTRVLQDALGGNSQTALLCCCSPSPSNASETLSTLRFAARAKHVKTLVHPFSPSPTEHVCSRIPEVHSPNKDEACERILTKLRENLRVEDVGLIEELFLLEGIFFDPSSAEEVKSAYEDITTRTIMSLHQEIEALIENIEQEDKMEKTTPLEDNQLVIVQTVIRCAKAAILLSSLKNSLNSNRNCLIPSKDENEETEMLKLELVKEKVKNKKMKATSVMDLVLQMLLLLMIWTLCLCCRCYCY